VTRSDALANGRPYLAQQIREGYRSRLSDYLNRGDMNFIPLANASISPIDAEPGAADRRDFIAVARTHIHLAYPESTDAAESG
jgi:hypothetical protein